MFPLKIVSSSILYVMGWNPIDANLLCRLNHYDRQILVYNHTSYADFFIMLLYMFKYNTELYYMRTLMKPQPFRYIGRILNFFGIIPSTKVDDKNGGAVDRICSELVTRSKSLLLISPKGTIVQREWRTGYYNIAKKTHSLVVAMGLDYEEKKVKGCKHISTLGITESEVRDKLKKDLYNIVPLHPENEMMDIRPHDEWRRSLINTDHMFMCVYVSALLCLISNTVLKEFF